MGAAIRHGIGRDRKALIFMPSDAFQVFGDADLAAVIAHLRSLPPVDRSFPRSRIGPLARVLHVVAGFPLLPAERVDQAARRSEPAAGSNVTYGEYLATASACRSCHGTALAGGAGPGPNITTGRLGSWSEADFKRLLRDGKRPDGSTISDEMPWKSYRGMSDQEMTALWLYLRSVPPVTPRQD